MKENDIGTILIETSIEIHKKLGPGLLESVYEAVLAYELNKKGLSVARQVKIPIVYEEMTFKEGFRADLIIEDKVIVELKSKIEISPADRKQIQTYLVLTKLKLGYLLNFGQALLKDGIVRVVNGLEEN